MQSEPRLLSTIHVLLGGYVSSFAFRWLKRFLMGQSSVDIPVSR